MKNNIQDYVYRNPKELLDLFVMNKIVFPKKLRIESLKEVIIPTLVEDRAQLKKEQEESEKSLSITKINRLIRLKYVDHLSEIQLEQEYELKKDKDLNETYLNVLWGSIENHIRNELEREDVLTHVYQLDLDKDLQNTKSVMEYNAIFEEIFLDDKEYLDGIHYSEFRTYLYHTSNLNELMKLGGKYGVKVPKNFTKHDLQLRLVEALEEKGSLTEELRTKIMETSSKEIKTMLSEYGVNSKTYLTKEEMIEFILKNQTELNYLYVKPEHENVYGIQEGSETKKEEIEIHEPKEMVRETTNVVLKQEPFDQTYLAMMASSLNRIADTQDKILDRLENLDKRMTGQEKSSLWDKSLNYVLVVLVVVVVVIWVIYGFNTLI